MSVHIGKLIGKKIEEVGMTKSEFGRRISTSPQHAHFILKKKSINTDLLRKISLTLDYDFFQHYLGLHPKGKSIDNLIDINTSELRLTLISVKKEIETLETHNGYLREIVSLIGPIGKTLSAKALKMKNKKNKPNK